MKINQNKTINPVVHFLVNNAVPLFIFLLVIFSIPLSGLSGTFLINEIITRFSRDLPLILALLIPVMAGMGMNFSIVLGAMSGQIGLIFLTDWQIAGVPGLLLAILISTPIAVLLGYFAGVVLNLAKGKEMVTGFILAFFMDGIYQIIVLFGMGTVIPIITSDILLPNGYGVKNSVNFIGVRQVLEKLIPLKIGQISIPVGNFIVIAILCLFIIWLKKTKFGQEIQTVGNSNEVARMSGINVEKTRILSIIISTVLACYGQIIFLQNIGTMSTYNSHQPVGVFAIAALLVGGASVTKATIPHAFIGVILFHTLFVVAPRAGVTLIGVPQLGEYFRVFVSYGVIALSLALYAWRKRVEKENERKKALNLKRSLLAEQ